MILSPADCEPAPPAAPANALWNAGLIQPYWFDDSSALPACRSDGRCMSSVAATSFQPGQYLLIETQAESPADPPIRQIVQLLDAGDVAGPWAVEEIDVLFSRSADPPGSGPPWMTVPTSPPAALEPTAVTRIAWRASDTLASDRDLTRTTSSETWFRPPRG